MGQNIDALSNTIQSFYEKAAQWSEMSTNERGQFMSENAEIFSGEDGDKILRAFETQNYALIQQALQDSEVLQNKMTSVVQDLQQDLAIEMARSEEKQNKAYIKFLQEQINLFSDQQNIFSASLKLMLDQQNAELEAYKEFLQKENDALTESLEKRRDAYQNYFDAINQKAEDDEYEENVNQLITNLSRIGSTSDMASNKQAAELTSKLEDLEKERLEQLRERAQQQVLDSIDDQLEVITEKFDQLIESNRELLAAMRGDLSDGGASMFAKMFSQQYGNGLTGLELNEWIQSFGTTFGSNTDLDLAEVRVGEDNGNLYLDVNGQTVNLTQTDSQSLYEAIINAMKQMGITV